MTGFGSASHRDRDLHLEVEVRSVNHRFITVKQGLPESLSRRETEVDQRIRERLGRGSVTVSVSLKTARSEGPALPDVKAMKAVYKRLCQARKALGIKGEVDLEDVLAVPTLWSSGDSGPAEATLWPRVRKLLDEALDALVDTRAREGEKIETDFKARLDAIGETLVRIRARVPAVAESYQKRLDERIQAILTQKGLEVAKADISKEVAVHADRCDISEELQRLGAHTEEFRKIIRAKGQVGRRLDFLSQEMLREINTIASKGNDAEISSCAVMVKAEIEKIKEQVENVE